MRRLFGLAALLLALGVTAGCGGGNEVTGAKGPMTDEEKQKSAQEMRQVDEEESQGSVNKKKRR